MCLVVYQWHDMMCGPILVLYQWHDMMCVHKGGVEDMWPYSGSVSTA